MFTVLSLRPYHATGIPLRTGRFTAAENKQLKQNVKDFLDVSGIDSEFKLFRPQRFPDEKGTIRRLKRELNFLRSLCEYRYQMSCMSMRHVSE